MHHKYTNVKYVFLSIKIYEKQDFKGSQAKLAAYTWFFIYYVIPTTKQKRSACTRADLGALSSGRILSLKTTRRRLSFGLV